MQDLFVHSEDIGQRQVLRVVSTFQSHIVYYEGHHSGGFFFFFFLGGGFVFFSLFRMSKGDVLHSNPSLSTLFSQQFTRAPVTREFTSQARHTRTRVSALLSPTYSRTHPTAINKYSQEVHSFTGTDRHWFPHYCPCCKYAWIARL